jgi:hypothetical protein
MSSGRDPNSSRGTQPYVYGVLLVSALDVFGRRVDRVQLEVAQPRRRVSPKRAHSLR